MYCQTAKQSVCFNVTTRNAGPLLEQCLTSIVSQTCADWFCVLTDDASDDCTLSIAGSYSSQHPGKFQVVHNRRRKGKLENFALALAGVDPSSIIVELDGDDRLTIDTFVDEIQRLHTRYDVVWTQHEVLCDQYPDWHVRQSTQIPDDWTRNTPVRSGPWSPNYFPGHLRTFKKAYFDKIRKADLKHGGKWLQVTADVAYFTPILEMTAPHLRYFYDRVCARYVIHSSNDYLQEREERSSNPYKWQPAKIQTEMGRYIKSLPEYDRMRVVLVVCVATRENLTALVGALNRLKQQDPLIRLHVMCQSGDIASEVLVRVRVFATFVYDLERMGTNELSPLLVRFGPLPVTVLTGQFFGLHFLKTVLDHNIYDEAYFTYGTDLDEVPQAMCACKTTGELLHVQAVSEQMDRLGACAAYNMVSYSVGGPCLSIAQVQRALVEGL
jgi:glycosyltransferase involved in cell wall biosynthesis